MANSNGSDSTHLGKAVVTFSGRPEKQPSEWRKFEQRFLATMREIGLGDVLTGRVRQPQEPAAQADAETRTAHKTESLTYKRKNGKLYGRLPTSVANGNLGYDSPAVSTVLAHGPVCPETEGNGYQAFQALKTKYEADTKYRPWDLEQRLRSAKLLPEDRLDS